ncbi:MAG: ClpXP protease specificity-enhancing factor [Pseudomonadales bacterium]|nr:ClpXP protease specificity-enhancing factor [Pseudomonadales bacterium]
MTPSRPYFIRAVYEWILDNDLTPYLLVNANYPMVQVPTEFVSEGKIILNLMPSAIRNLHMGNDELEFSARFGGKPRNVYVPIGAILAVYAKENGKGMFFDENEMPPPPDDDDNGGDDEPPKPSGKPSLKVVK